MPYPSQVNREQIIESAREFIKTDGVSALTLSKLAGTLGVKAPSLYRHVANKDALLQQVNLLTLQEMAALFDSACSATAGSETVDSIAVDSIAVDELDGSPAASIVKTCNTYRQFAHANPELYALAMTAKPGEGRPDEDALVAIILPMQALVAQISGEENGLTALRGLLALVHGYVMLELNQQFQRGGDLDQTFEAVIKSYMQGWMSER